MLLCHSPKIRIVITTTIITHSQAFDLMFLPLIIVVLSLVKFSGFCVIVFKAEATL